MIPDFDLTGNLPPGVYWASWNDVVGKFGVNPWRKRLLDGLFEALTNLKMAGCRTVYLDGSFVSNKIIPNDYDACWEETGVNPQLLDPVLLTFDPGRATQKAKYMGEFFPASIPVNPDGMSFIEFFQIDKVSGNPKGILALDPGGIQ